MKRLLVCMVVGAVVACFALAGCAGGSSSSASSASSSSLASESSASASSASAAASSASASGSSASAAASSEASSASAESASSAASSASSESASSSKAAPAVGGWTVPPSTGDPVSTDLTDEEKEIFDKAIDAQPDMFKGDDQPIAVLATQVVAGKNIAYLCKSAPASPDSGALWAIIVVYNDLQGNASVTSAGSIDLADIATTNVAPDGQMTGAWEIREATNGVAMTAEAAQAFSKASENYDGAQINPLALLGTQVVSGTNYLILGTGPASADNPATVLYVATVYEDLQGNAKFTDVSQFDLLAYV